MLRKKVGTIIVPPGVFLGKHEKLTADYIAVELCWNITFLVPNRYQGARTPDIEIDGIKWEIKSPKGKGSRVIENILREAIRQSPYIIFDLRRLDGRIPTHKHLKEIERQFNLAKRIKHLVVITREERHIDFKR